MAKIARFRVGDRVCYGVVDGKKVAEIEGDVFGKYRVNDKRHNLSQVKLLAPTTPRTCIGIGPGYRTHLDFATKLMGKKMTAPPVPNPWRKGENSIIGPEEPIVIPKDSVGDCQPEGEIVIVIGKQCRRATEANATKYILGYTCGNDFSERKWQVEDTDFWRAKGSDTFGPVGPWIATDIDPLNQDVEVRVNGKVVQKGHTSELFHGIAKIVQRVSEAITLMPGDLIFTGTPGTPATVKPGDVIEVEVSGIGVLRNPVVKEK